MEQKQFGRYVIVSELGRGAMGAVHCAVDPLIERDVAIKTLLPSLPPEIMGEVRERFLREVPRLPIASIADLVAQVADGPDLAQRFRITHRDVKPANIMVSVDWRAKLTDFGVAHVASSSMTQTGSALGSPKYMSPEQVTGQPVDPCSDIILLGAVLYEILVRRTPLERKGDNTVFAVLHRIAGEAHAAGTQIDPQIPAAFNILDRALAKSPDKRYQRAGDMVNNLRNYKSVVGSSPAADAGHAKTLDVPRAQPKPAQAGTATATLIQDLDVFAKGFERERDAKTGITQAGSRRSAALEMLKQKVADRTAVVSADQSRKTESIARIDERLRAAFRYLSEFATVLNEANLVSDGKQGVMFFGDCAGKSCADYVTFKYRVRFPRPQKLAVSGQEAQRIQEQLKGLGGEARVFRQERRCPASHPGHLRPVRVFSLPGRAARELRRTERRDVR